MYPINEATCWEIKSLDGIDCYVEAQEHCDLIDYGNTGGFSACRFTVNPETKECFVQHQTNPDKSFCGTVVNWSFDYGRTWEVGQ